MRLIPIEYDGEGLFGYCNCCKTQFKETCGLKKDCDPKNDWRYKMIQHIPALNGPGKKKTKICTSRTLKGALQELQEFKASFKNKFDLFDATKGFTIQDGIDAFLRKKFNEGEYSSQRTELSTSHRSEIVRVMQRFKETLTILRKDPKKMLLAELNANLLTPFYSVVEKYGSSDAMKDRHTRIMRSFISFLELRGMYSGGNFFLTISCEKITDSPISIENEELRKTIEAITPENGIGMHGKNRTKNYYVPWLKYAFELARYTGCRAEELFELKWDNLINYTKNGQQFQLFVIHNLKAERLNKTEKKTVLKVLPVTEEFKKLLEVIKNSPFTGQRVIESNMTFGYFKDFMSRSFTHFYSVAHKETEKKYFKQLRKARLTDISALLGEDANLLTSHSSKNILDKHYVDKIQAAIKMMELKANEERNSKQKKRK